MTEKVPIPLPLVLTVTLVTYVRPCSSPIVGTVVFEKISMVYALFAAAVSVPLSVPKPGIPGFARNVITGAGVAALLMPGPRFAKIELRLTRMPVAR